MGGINAFSKRLKRNSRKCVYVYTYIVGIETYTHERKAYAKRLSKRIHETVNHLALNSSIDPVMALTHTHTALNISVWKRH